MMAVHEFVKKHLDLLDSERLAEIEQTSELLGKLSVKELERRGICLLKLRCSSQATGLYGRTVLTFEPLRSQGQDVKLPAHNFGPGDIAGVSYSNGDTNTASLLASGIVSKVTGSVIAVAFEENVEGLSKGYDDVFKLTKLANDVTYRRLKRALHDLDECRAGPAARLIEVLFGEGDLGSPIRLTTADGNSDDLSFFNKNLNESQRDAVTFALCQREVAVIHGPPGTGKTTTVVEIIQQAVKRNMKVLACAPSNVAVDNLLERLASNPTCSMVRLGHPARLLPTIQRFALDAILAGSDGAAIVRDIRRDIDNAISQIRKTKDKDEKYRLRDEMKYLRKDLKSREDKAIQDILTGADVVLATNTGATSGRALKALKQGHFDLVVIDECAQALEAACWIPLLNAQRCLLAGDHHQLPATIMSRQAAAEGLATSLMERIIDLHGNQVVRMLTTQYRMNDQIMQWSSDSLYDGKLESHETVAGHLLKDLPSIADNEDTSLAVLLIDTAGCDITELELEDEVSKGNEGEADLVAHHVTNLVSSGLRPAQIAVIAPYNLQVDLLRLRLSVKYPSLEIKSVDGFQGREKEAVVISLVRSNDRGEVGFLTEDRRINVAITRARRHLAVICDSQTVGKHAFLKGLLDYMSDHGEVRSAFEYDEVLNSSFEAPRPDHLVFKAKRPASSSSSSHHHSNSSTAGSRTGARPKEYRKGLGHQGSRVKGHGSVDQSERKKEDVSFQNEATRRLQEFQKEPEESVVEFPSSLSSQQRYVVHELAETLGLFHISVGEGKARRIAVAKKKSALPMGGTGGTGQDEIVTPVNDDGGVDSNLTVDIDELVDEFETSNLLENLPEEENENIDSDIENIHANIGVETLNVDSRKATKNDVDKSEINNRTTADGVEKSEVEQTKEKRVAGAKTNNVDTSDGRASDLLRCKLCKKAMTPGNLILHEIQCEKVVAEKKRVSAAVANSKKKTKKHRDRDGEDDRVKRKSGLEDADTDDFDKLVEAARRHDNECAFERCREKITITGQMCRYCTRRYCFKHHIPEVHGCTDAARHHVRQQTLKAKVVTNGSGFRDPKPLDPAQRASLQKKIGARVDKLEEKRQRKPKKK